MNRNIKKIYVIIILCSLYFVVSALADGGFRAALDAKDLSTVLNKFAEEPSVWPVIESELNCKKKEGEALRVGLENLSMAKDLLALTMAEIEADPEGIDIVKVRQFLAIEGKLRQIGGDANYVLAHMFTFIAAERVLEMVLRGREHDAEIRNLIAQRKRLDPEAPVKKLWFEIAALSNEWEPARMVAEHTKYPANMFGFFDELRKHQVFPPSNEIERLATCHEMLTTPSYSGLFMLALRDEASITFIAAGALEYFSKGGTWERLYKPNTNPIGDVLGKSAKHYKFLPFNRISIENGDLQLRKRCLDKQNLVTQCKEFIKQ